MLLQNEMASPLAGEMGMKKDSARRGAISISRSVARPMLWIEFKPLCLPIRWENRVLTKDEKARRDD
ncbi:hypothetical protein DSCO28_61970 [Desulfosarcina ovata subsp. sediminis]|uniref:Uncharacterized protein n=1 Tax=Desulfosarcina ovata subsp. sediminis TaxID=885957 RepID=A0A5K7ZZQ8_9BACT|nr:hypothetical protein DSCO28_61970 [Desulfosarcina ovata subsp. sediminis]